MTLQEMSNEFDILYNNITSNQAPGLDEYEKSVFLTKAQDEIIKDYFNPSLNKPRAGFDGNERRQIDFSSITAVTSYEYFTPAVLDHRTNSVRVNLNSDVMMLLNEFVDVNRKVGVHEAEEGGESNTPIYESVRLVVVPLSYVEYLKEMNKPFKRPLHYQAWRLVTANLNTTNNNKFVELVVGPSDSVVEYTIRYVKKPKAIILVDLSTLDPTLTIEGEHLPQACELDQILHPEIVQRAAELAKVTYTGGVADQLAVGRISSTELGMLTKES